MREERALFLGVWLLRSVPAGPWRNKKTPDLRHEKPIIPVRPGWLQAGLWEGDATPAFLFRDGLRVMEMVALACKIDAQVSRGEGHRSGEE
jgi:hypothetical protein